MIPMELISMGASTILGGVLSIMAQKGKDAAEAQNRLMARAGFAAEQADKAREVQDPFTKNTRRWIALMCVFAIIVLPKIVFSYETKLLSSGSLIEMVAPDKPLPT